MKRKEVRLNSLDFIPRLSSLNPWTRTCSQDIFEKEEMKSKGNIFATMEVSWCLNSSFASSCKWPYFSALMVVNMVSRNLLKIDLCRKTRSEYVETWCGPFWPRFIDLILTWWSGFYLFLFKLEVKKELSSLGQSLKMNLQFSFFTSKTNPKNQKNKKLKCQVERKFVKDKPTKGQWMGWLNYAKVFLREIGLIWAWVFYNLDLDKIAFCKGVFLGFELLVKDCK